MKRIIKQFDRKGFTLVETLLATFILVVVSTMLVNGFISTMGYSYQTSVYSKSAANNYSTCMSTLASWSSTPNKGDDGREARGKGFCNGDPAQATELVFVNPWEAPLENLYVHVESATGLSTTVPGALPYGEHSYAPTADDLADNRKTFVYYPEFWQKPGDNSTLGNVIVMYVASSKKYYWVVDTGNFDTPTYCRDYAIGEAPPSGGGGGDDTSEPG